MIKACQRKTKSAHSAVSDPRRRAVSNQRAGTDRD